MLLECLAIFKTHTAALFVCLAFCPRLWQLCFTSGSNSFSETKSLTLPESAVTGSARLQAHETAMGNMVDSVGWQGE